MNKLKMDLKSRKGITLISLVITIIILLILAGISIQAITNTGLFENAKRAAEESKYANAEEKVKMAVMASYDENASLNKDLLKDSLNKIYGINPKVTEVTWDLTVNVDGYEFTITELGTVTCVGRKEQEKLPENTPENPQDAGTEVALKEGWGEETTAVVKTSDGTEVTGLTKVSTVYAVSVGNGETIPVPQGFYYVGGNLDTGVIISDNEADKYNGQTDKTTYEYTTSLQGNQFVWIPCTSDGANGTIKYEKTSWGKQKAGWDTTTPKSELSQIEKYGGFYVGRYEAGLADTITEFTTNQKDGSSSIYNLDGVPQSKAGIVPWMFIDWTHSKANAESMYNNNYVSSGLITGTQWDVMLKKMVGKTIGETTGDSKVTLTEANLTNSSSWGNCMDNAISYTGRLARLDYNSTNSKAWTIKPFGAATTGTTSSYSSNNGDLLTTGASKTAQVYHIYDVAGNLLEWTEEDSHYATSGQYRMWRGTSCLSSSKSDSASFRGCDDFNRICINIGFRAVLYIK